MSKIDLIKQTFSKVLVLDFETIKELRDLLLADEIVVIQEKHTEEKKYQFDELNSLKIILYYISIVSLRVQQLQNTDLFSSEYLHPEIDRHLI